MTAPTTAVRFLLARAAVRASGTLHVVSQRDSGLLMPVCGANPIRSRTIETADTFTGFTALYGDGAVLCGDCSAIRADRLLDVFDPTPGSNMSEVRVSDVYMSAGHARADLGDLDALTASIRLHGVLQPILVRSTGAGYEVIAGARRLAAAAAAGLVTVPAIVRDTTDTDATLIALVENVHRQDLNPIDLAHAYERIIRMTSVSKAELGRRLGISREQVSNTIRLLGLSPEDQARVASGELTAADGRARLAKRTPKPVPLADVATQLGQAWDARVLVTSTARRDRIVIDVPAGDLQRILTTLGIEMEQTA